jgi:tetratricopeptide (TPR) repeat protein
LALLARFASPSSEAAIRAAIADPNPLVRAAVPRTFQAAPAPAMFQAAAPLLSEPVRAVRIETARALAGVDQRSMTPEQQTAFAAAYLELFDAEMIDADRPEAHLNLGLLETRLGHPTEAANHFRTALHLDQNFTPALVNLADLDRMRGLNQEGVDLLRKAMAIDPNNADIHHSLDLALVRQHNYPGIAASQRACARQCALRLCLRDRAEFYWRGRIGDGALENNHKRHPTDRDTLLDAILVSSGETFDDGSQRRKEENTAIDLSSERKDGASQIVGCFDAVRMTPVHPRKASSPAAQRSDTDTGYSTESIVPGGLRDGR